VSAQFIVPCHPAVRHLRTPQVEHLQALLVARLILNLRRHVAFLASLLIPYPLMGQGQAKVEQGVIVAGHVPHVDPDLTVVDLAPVPTPLALDPDRVRAALREAAGIKGDDPIGFTQPIDYLSNQNLDQRPVVPGRRTDEVLHDQALDIDQGSNLLGILAVQMGQETCQVEVDIALAGLGLESVLIGHDEIAQTINHVMEHVGGNDAVTQQFLLSLCPRRCHLFASSNWHADAR